jgi:hypothetical protein
MPYKQNLLNFRHHFLFGVPSKIFSFYRHYFTDKALNILFKFVCRLRNVSKNKNFEFSHNLKWYIIRITHVKTHKLLQVCKQVVTNLFTSCRQVGFALLVPSCCNKFGTKLLTTCNMLDGIIRLVTRLF